MTIYNSRQLRQSRRYRSLSSWHSEESDEGHPRSLEDEIDDIHSSLDTLEDNIKYQQFLIAQELEDHVKHVYDGVLYDIGGIRSKMNSVGDLLSAAKKLKYLNPTLISNRTIHHIRNLTDIQTLKSSKSLDDLDSTQSLHYKLKPFQRLVASGKLCNSSYSIYSASRKQIANQVQGYGSCFYGDNKIYPYSTHRSKFHCKTEHSEAILETRSDSKLGSRSDVREQNKENSSCMHGDITDDWRVKVTPYMWDGWDTPGLDKREVAKFRDRLTKLQEFREDLLHVQNVHRHRHGCPPFVLSDILSHDSQEWANRLALMGYAQYSELPDRGENILVVDIEYDLTGRQVADTWYREGRYFDYHNPRWQKGSRNFSQMIWRSSREVGIGITKFPGQNTYVIVTQYYPAGNNNTSGEFRENVPPVKHFESSV